MELPVTVTSALSSLLEQLFTANDEARDALQPHVGGLITIELNAPDLTVHVLVLDHTLEVLSVADGDADAMLQSDWPGLMALSRGSDALLSGKAHIRGNLRLVEGVHRAVTLLAVDWEDQIAPYVGDTLAQKISSLVRRGRRETARNREQDSADLHAYLTQETGLVPNRTQWRELTDQTDTLRQDLDRLSARLNRLDSES